MVKKQILVVDGQLDTYRSIAAHMQKEEITVCHVASASEALDRITKVDCCLVILSNQLSGISSVEMLRIIRLTQRIPIMVLTMPLRPDEKVALFQAGAEA